MMNLEEKISNHATLCEETLEKLKLKGIRGKWEDEPHRLNWKHAGLDCMIVRSPHVLHLCGYVGVPPSHPAYGLNYDEVESIDVHGGLTYSAACGGHICHKAEPGEPDELHWFGFDCAHYMDLSPGLRTGRDLVYRDIDWVKSETEKLARQLAK